MEAPEGVFVPTLSFRHNRMGLGRCPQAESITAQKDAEHGRHQSQTSGPIRGSGRRYDNEPTVRSRPDRQTEPPLRGARRLKTLDPVWSTAYITRNHGYLVYDTLFGTDEHLQVKPQMVDQATVSPDGMKYTFTLRDGLRWHDGQPVVAEDCVESLNRWGKRDRFGQLLMAHTARIRPVDKKTFTLELGERFGPVLDALGKPSGNVPFMPARIASTPPEEQIKDVVGSGRSNSPKTSGNKASRSCIGQTSTTSRATSHRAEQRAARRCMSTR
jgi:hypothetical protein